MFIEECDGMLQSRDDLIPLIKMSVRSGCVNADDCDTVLILEECHLLCNALVGIGCLLVLASLCKIDRYGPQWHHVASAAFIREHRELQLQPQCHTRRHQCRI